VTSSRHSPQGTSTPANTVRECSPFLSDVVDVFEFQVDVVDVYEFLFDVVMTLNRCELFLSATLQDSYDTACHALRSSRRAAQEMDFLVGISSVNVWRKARIAQ
jgi:hypothetical protein